MLAQTRAPGCVPTPFNAVYDVRSTYAPTPPDPATTAVAYNDARIVNWATGVASYLPGTGVSDPKWMMPTQAFGPAGTDTTAVVVLGNGGTITLTFASPITDGASWDFAVFENSFASDLFLELGFVEVSSDGSHFARFDSAFRGAAAPCGSCSGTAAQIGGLAGSLHGRLRNAVRSGGASQRSPGARRLRRSDRHQVRPHRRHRRRRDDARFLRPRGSSIPSPAGRPPGSTSTASPFSTSSCDDAQDGWVGWLPSTDAPRPYAESLCWRCAHHRTIKTARSSFLMCNVLPSKYPRQPVSSCAAFSTASHTSVTEAQVAGSSAPTGARPRPANSE